MDRPEPSVCCSRSRWASSRTRRALHALAGVLCVPGLMIVARSDWEGRLVGEDVLVGKGGIDQIHRPVSHRFEDRKDGLLSQVYSRSIVRIPSGDTRGERSAIDFNPTVKPPELQNNGWHSQKAVAVMCHHRQLDSS